MPSPKIVRVDKRPVAPLTLDERIEAVWELTLACLAWWPEDEREPRLRRSVARVLRPGR